MKISSALIELHPKCTFNLTYRIDKLLREQVSAYLLKEVSLTRKGIEYDLMMYILPTPNIDDVIVNSKPIKGRKVKDLTYSAYFPCAFNKRTDNLEPYIDLYFIALSKILELEQLVIPDERILNIKDKIKAIALGNPLYEINDDETAEFI